MKVIIKVTGALYSEMLDDLRRRHPFAAERVGFVSGRIGTLQNGGRMVLLTKYLCIPDEQYLQDPTVGARIGSEAITKAMQAAYFGRQAREGVFHVHLHSHRGATSMSRTDERETPPMIPGFQSVGRHAPHGIIILSLDHGSVWVWLPDNKDPIQVASVAVIGAPIGIFDSGASNER